MSGHQLNTGVTTPDSRRSRDESPTQIVRAPGRNVQAYSTSSQYKSEMSDHRKNEADRH